MVDITYPEDCGNAPKKIILRDFLIALVNNDYHFINEYVADNVNWEIVGKKQLEGKSDVIGELQKVDGVTSLRIENIITHGWVAAVNGTLDFKMNHSTSFCHIFKFNSAGKKGKIKEITSYFLPQ